MSVFILVKGSGEHFILATGAGERVLYISDRIR